MKKYYEEAKYNAAFDRCVDVMTQLLQKYGHQVLDKLEQDAPQTADCSKDDKQAQPLTDRLRKIYNLHVAYSLWLCYNDYATCIFVLWRKDRWIVKTEL
mgnify:CR=1 FL=1